MGMDCKGINTVGRLCQGLIKLYKVVIQSIILFGADMLVVAIYIL